MGRLPPDGRTQGRFGGALFAEPYRPVEKISLALRRLARATPLRGHRRRACRARCTRPLALPAAAECRAREGAAALLCVRPALSRRPGSARSSADRTERIAREN